MKARVITYQPHIDDIISKCEACNMAMIDDDNMPYVIPMNFGYKNGVIYFHSGSTGKKIDILKKRPNVAISFSTNHKMYMQHEDVACSYGMSYQGVFAFGKVEFIEDYDQKVEALNIIMKQYTDREFSYNRPAVVNVMVFIVKVEKFTGKEFGRF
ncbi:MAG: pyridoxamine 5'-phosphate oxidase family protein [Bacteroidales bacterium]|nr:pyridoxamine 5'-phosphate oxidase family protein [Bacteroidales bacterium]MCF8458637.1 pyridoxamine 5'-phosphate oxidase family protein [Bacteroidales bacterium]